MKNISVFLFLLMVCACAQKTTSRVEGEIGQFLREFNLSLNKGDSTQIMAHFGPQGDVWSLNKALEMLENKQKDIPCNINIEDPVLVWDEAGLRVDLRVTLHPAGREQEFSFITLWLDRYNGKFIVKKMDADRFFAIATDLAWRLEYQNQLTENLVKVKPYYDMARHLQNNFDTVVWYSRTNDKTFYYVANGDWTLTNDHLPDSAKYNMGLFDEAGKEIVPAKFDLIGTFGIVFRGLFEVSRNGKIGYYSSEGKEVLPALYDKVIPYRSKDTVAFASRDTIQGWLDHDFVFHASEISDELSEYINRYKFLSAPLTLSAEAYSLCIVPNVSGMGSGIIIPPAYLVKYGVFAMLETGIMTNDGIAGIDIPPATEYIEKRDFHLFELSSAMKFLFNNFKTRYLEGREEFYTSSLVTVVDAHQDTLSTMIIPGGETMKVDRKDENLFEVVVLRRKSLYTMMGHPGVSNYPDYRYFRREGNSLKRLESHRDNATTQFVKLDSSYVTGKFEWVWKDNEPPDTLTFIPSAYLENWRNDIMADYGFVFVDSEMNDRLTYCKWYEPSLTTWEEVYAAASEIDKHNLDFINRIIGPYPAKPVPAKKAT